MTDRAIAKQSEGADWTNYNRSLMQRFGNWIAVAADPDERRTRGTHSWCAPPLLINAGHHAAVETGLTMAAQPLGTGWCGSSMWFWCSWRVSSGRHLEGFALGEHGPGHAGVLGCDGDYRLPVAASLLQLKRPDAEPVGLVLGRSQHGACAHHQQAAQVGVTGLGDAPQAGLAARAVLAGHQAEPGGELAPAFEVAPVANHGDHGRGDGLADAAQAHELLGRVVVTARHLPDVGVVLGDAFVQAGDLTEQVTDDEVGVAGQVFEVTAGFAPHGGGLERQHDAELREQTTNAVERCGSCFDEPLAGAVHHQALLLLDALDGDEQHVRANHGFADRGGVGGVVLGAPPRQPIGCDELGRHQPHGVTVRREQPRPVVRAGARFHPHDAGRQRGDQFRQLGPRHARAFELRLAKLIDAVHGKNILGEIDTNGQNRHGLPLPSELMSVRASHRGTLLPVAAMRPARDGEVPFIR